MIWQRRADIIKNIYIRTGFKLQYVAFHFISNENHSNLEMIRCVRY